MPSRYGCNNEKQRNADGDEDVEGEIPRDEEREETEEGQESWRLNAKIRTFTRRARMLYTAQALHF